MEALIICLGFLGIIAGALEYFDAKVLKPRDASLRKEISALRVFVAKMHDPQRAIQQQPHFLEYGELASAERELDNVIQQMEEHDPMRGADIWQDIEALKVNARAGS